MLRPRAVPSITLLFVICVIVSHRTSDVHGVTDIHQSDNSDDFAHLTDSIQENDPEPIFVISNHSSLPSKKTSERTSLGWGINSITGGGKTLFSKEIICQDVISPLLDASDWSRIVSVCHVMITSPEGSTDPISSISVKAGVGIEK